MRSSRNNSSSQPQHYERLYDLLIGSSIDVETQLISSAISKNSKVEKQIEDVQVILNEHRLKTLQNTMLIIESIVNQGDAQQNLQNFQKVVEEHSTKYTQIQMLHQMKNVINQKIIKKIEILNSMVQEDRSQALSELEVLSLSLEKVEKALLQISSPWDIGVIGEGFSVLKDLQTSTYQTERNYENQNRNKQRINQQNKDLNDEQNREADNENEESHLYADETESMHETTQKIDLYATQEFNNNNLKHNNLSYQSYQKPPKEDAFHSNLKLITPVAYKMHSIGYKTEPDSAMTPLHSEDMMKNNIYKTPSDNNNKKVFKNNLNVQHQGNNDLNHRMNNNGAENNNGDSYNPQIQEAQVSETVSAGDLISPQITNNDNRQTIGQDCTSFNKSEESSRFTLQFDVSAERLNENNALTFGNGNIISNNLINERNSANSQNYLFSSNLMSRDNQTQQIPDNKNKLLDMFDACLNSLQHPDLMEQKKILNLNETDPKNIIEEEDRQNESIDEFVLHEKEIIEDFHKAQNDQNENQQNKTSIQQKEEDKLIEFNRVNVCNVSDIEESKGDDTSFFSQRQSHFNPFTQNNNYTVKEIKIEQTNKQTLNDHNFISTFGLNQNSQILQKDFLENKFGQDHFDADNLLENKISALKKQLFSTNALGNLTASFLDAPSVKQSGNTDTIKPVMSRKDEMEALGEVNSTDVEQFKIIDESPNLQEEEDQKINNDKLYDSSQKLDEIQIEIQNKRQLFEESNKFYHTLEQETLKQIQQQTFQKSDELQASKYIDEEDCNDSQDCDESQKDENYQQFQKQTLTENQFMQPISREIPNYANQYENLVNQFLNNPKTKSENYNNLNKLQNQEGQSYLQDNSKNLEQNKQVASYQQQIFGSTFGIKIGEVPLNNSFTQDKQPTIKFVQDKIEEEEDEEKQNDNIPHQESLKDHKRQKELTKCRVFESQDFFNSEQINQIQQIKEEDTDENCIEKIKQKLITNKNDYEINNPQIIDIPNKFNNEFQESDSFEREETPSFHKNNKNNILSKLPSSKLYSNQIQQAKKRSKQDEIQLTTLNCRKINKDQEEDDENDEYEEEELKQQIIISNSQQQQQKQQLILTAQFPSQQKLPCYFLENSTNINKEQQNDSSQDKNEDKVEINLSPKILEEPIEMLMEDYPLLFKNASLQQLITQQQKQCSDFQKTSKITKPTPQKIKPSSVLPSYQKIQKSSISQIEGKSNNSMNKSQITSVPSSTYQKKILPKNQNQLPQNNSHPSQQQNINQQLGLLARKQNSSLNQIPLPQQPQQEKENYKSQQNSEQKINKSEFQDQQQQINLKKTLKNQKQIGPVDYEKQRIRSSSIKNDEAIQQSNKDLKEIKVITQKQQDECEQQQQLKGIPRSTSSNKIKQKNLSAPMVGKKLSTSNLIINTKFTDK